jgi:FRG domain
MTIATCRLQTWDEVRRYAQHGWIYRGQSSSAWDLATSLERCCSRHEVKPKNRYALESRLIREFPRAMHQYAVHIPDADAVIEWLSIMQHYGAPTRLLDFTYSIYVAAYFAVESGDDDAAVWAIDGPWALNAAMKRLSQAGKPRSLVSQMPKPYLAEDERKVGPLFLKRPFVRAAWPINAFRLNERLRIQQGVFLIPGDIAYSVMDNIAAQLDNASADRIVKLVIPAHEKRRALRDLYTMHISRASLFPGLDGYARSLGVYHSLYDPVDWHNRHKQAGKTP